MSQNALPKMRAVLVWTVTARLSSQESRSSKRGGRLSIQPPRSSTTRGKPSIGYRPHASNMSLTVAAINRSWLT